MVPTDGSDVRTARPASVLGAVLSVVRLDHVPGVPYLPARHPRLHLGRVSLLTLQLCALAGQVLAVYWARKDFHRSIADGVSIASMGVMYASVVWQLTRPQLTRLTRNIAVACLAITPTLMTRATDPLLFTGFDEQQHMRTLRDILVSHHLFEQNPSLSISPFYPGLETVTVFFDQLGLPTMLAALAVILIARLVLLFLLCDIVEDLTGSARAGGLAVAIYAMSPQFVWFNSQFAYQTVALPMALGAISLIGRARKAADPLPFFGGATVCLLGLAMTHHVTSFLTTAFLVLWTLVERRGGRVRVAYGALAAVAATVMWAVVQHTTVQRYFGLMIEDWSSQVGGGVRRKAFQNDGGLVTPLVDKVLLLNYAVAVSLTSLTLILLTVYWRRRREHDLHYLNPELLILGISLTLPMLLAARVVPAGVEIFTRSSSFLFLPLSFVLINYLCRLDWWGMGRFPDRPPQDHARQPTDRELIAHIVAVVVATTVFLGGYVFGSGTSFGRLPGPYMPAADSRSMDAETLAAVEWAGKSLPPGSVVAGDRVSSILLASAGLFPVYEGVGGVKTPELYVAPNWGFTETDEARALRIRYLYVDRRMAESLPPFGHYFGDGEPDSGKQLTNGQLTKFDKVPAIKEVYRHGPVSIYDLKELGLPDYRFGWSGPTPVFRPLDQLAVGLMVGLLLAVVVRSRLWPRIRDQASRLRRDFGSAASASVVLAAIGLVSAELLLTHVWLTPLVVWSAALVVVLTNPGKVATTVRRAASHVTRRGVRTAALFLIPFAAIMGFSIYDAAVEDVVRVDQILDDPAAVHVTPDAPKG